MAKTKKNKKDNELIKLSRESKIQSSIDKNGNVLHLGKSGYLKETGALDNKTLTEIQQADFIQNSSDMNWLTRFNRLSYLDPYNTLTHNKEYIFITKPDLHLFEGKSSSALNSEIKDNTYFLDMFERYRHVMKQLQYSVNTSNPYLCILSNSIASSIELPSINSLESESPENLYGDKISYRHGSAAGDVGFEFSLEFYETKNLEIYNLFKMWDKYYELKSNGRITPPDDSYILNMELHDQVSIYKIIVGEDYETILFYAKYYGVYPKSLPRDSFGSLDDGNLKLSVDFKSSFVIDNDPLILADLNKISYGDKTGSVELESLWDHENDRVNYKWVGKPYVIKCKDISNGENSEGSMGKYKLKWGKK